MSKSAIKNKKQLVKYWKSFYKMIELAEAHSKKLGLNLLGEPENGKGFFGIGLNAKELKKIVLPSSFESAILNDLVPTSMSYEDARFKIYLYRVIWMELIRKEISKIELTEEDALIYEFICCDVVVGILLDEISNGYTGITGWNNIKMSLYDIALSEGENQVWVTEHGESFKWWGAVIPVEVKTSLLIPPPEPNDGVSRRLININSVLGKINPTDIERTLELIHEWNSSSEGAVAILDQCILSLTFSMTHSSVLSHSGKYVIISAIAQSSYAISLTTLLRENNIYFELLDILHPESGLRKTVSSYTKMFTKDGSRMEGLQNEEKIVNKKETLKRYASIASAFSDGELSIIEINGNGALLQSETDSRLAMCIIKESEHEYNLELRVVLGLNIPEESEPSPLAVVNALNLIVATAPDKDPYPIVPQIGPVLLHTGEKDGVYGVTIMQLIPWEILQIYGKEGNEQQQAEVVAHYTMMLHKQAKYLQSEIDKLYE